MASKLAEFEECAADLAGAAKALSKSSRSLPLPDHSTAKGDLSLPSPSLGSLDAPSEAQRARRSILANVNKLQLLLYDPTDFLQQLAAQTQLLACLHWLGEFQVLACIPLTGSVPFRDLADIAGVPESQLCRVVHMAATASFLHQPQPGHVAHTQLSAQFVTEPSLLDAALFLSETAAPAALQMATATRRFGSSYRPNETAYNLAIDTPTAFVSMCEQRPKLLRQSCAWLHHAMGDVDFGVVDVLTRLDWLSLGNATVVEVGAQSTAIATALADLYPALRVVVQTSEPRLANGSHLPPCAAPSSNGKKWASASPAATGFLSRASSTGIKAGERFEGSQLNSRITVQQRSDGTPQTVLDGAVYILRLASPSSPGLPSRSTLHGRIVAELRAHMGVLRANRSATLVLTTRLLPEPGTADPDVEAMARLRDLALFQIANEREIEEAEVTSVINSVSDRTGRLMLVDKLLSRTNATVAFEIKYQPYADRHEL